MKILIARNGAYQNPKRKRLGHARKGRAPYPSPHALALEVLLIRAIRPVSFVQAAA